MLTSTKLTEYRILAVRNAVDSRRVLAYDYSLKCPICKRHILVRFQSGMSEVRAERLACYCFSRYEVVGSDVYFVFVITNYR